MSNHDTRDMDRLEVRVRSWLPLDLMDARIRRQFPRWHGDRQKGRAEARIAKRQKARTNRRIGKMLCDGHE